MANALRLLLVLTLAAALASCGGDDSSSAPPGLDPAVANQLASASEDVATALEQHRCAGPAARELERRASAASVPARVRREVQRMIVRARISCPAAPPVTAPTTTADEDQDDGDGGGRGRGHDKHGKHKKKHGHGRGHGKDDE